MHIFCKGAGTRGGDGGERGEGDKDFQQMVATVASDARHASRERRTRGALRCDLATVLLRFGNFEHIFRILKKTEYVEHQSRIYFPKNLDFHG